MVKKDTKKQANGLVNGRDDDFGVFLANRAKQKANTNKTVKRPAPTKKKAN